MKPGYRYAAVCHRVIDGDTFIADVDLGFRVWARLKIRVRDYDAPERGEETWGDVKRKAEGFLFGNTHLILDTSDQPGAVTFDRWVARVWVYDALEDQWFDFATEMQR